VTLYYFGDLLNFENVRKWQVGVLRPCATLDIVVLATFHSVHIILRGPFLLRDVDDRGLVNSGNACFRSVIMQCLIRLPPFSR